MVSYRWVVGTAAVALFKDSRDFCELWRLFISPTTELNRKDTHKMDISIFRVLAADACKHIPKT